MSIQEKRKRRVSKDKQNAKQAGSTEKAKIPQIKRRGFYSRVLDEAGCLDFELASGVNGIDDEIALLRVTIKSVLEHDPENIKVIMEATNTLAHLLKIRFDITKEQFAMLHYAGMMFTKIFIFVFFLAPYIACRWAKK